MSEAGEAKVETPVADVAAPAVPPVVDAPAVDQPVAEEPAPEPEELSHYDRVKAAIADGRTKRQTPTFDDLDALAKALFEG